MCGLAGFWGGRFSAGESDAQLQRMTDAIAYRGPDAQGHWVDHGAGIALGHRRLAIVELSEAGAQPMLSFCGRYVLSFNGEIYNHLDLRDDTAIAARDIRWRGQSDTETLLNCFEVWGIAGTVQRAVGMFAFAVWDRKLRVLTLARDRFGEKPLYYGRIGAGASAVFLFASELSSFAAYPGFLGEVDRDSLCMYMRHGNVGGARTIFRGVQKLLPGYLLTLSDVAVEPAVASYWSLAQVAERGVADRFEGTPTEAVEALERIASRAVRQQMAADVPLGAFLSGGVDSSAIAALMQSQSMRRIKTFTIGFEDAGYNEAVHAKAVAQHLGTDHTELYVTPKEAIDTIGMLPRLYCEPFADSSQIPTYLVSRLARREGVKVSLSGDAGDEVFGGYNRYEMTARVWGRLSTVPVPVRRAAARLLLQLSPRRLDQLASRVPGLGRWPDLGGKIHKGARVMAASSAVHLYLGLVSQWSDPADVVLNCQEPESFLTGLRPALKGLGDVEQMMALDTLTYLPDDILTKVDRAAMSVGLETRVPFLDHRLVEFAWQLPLNYKLRSENDTTTKWILREMLFKHVPRRLIERPKQGFGIPIGSWLRGPLRDWAESLLGESRLRSDGFFDVAAVRGKWTEHLSGRRNWEHQLWCVLMFQAWHEEHLKTVLVL